MTDSVSPVFSGDMPVNGIKSVQSPNETTTAAQGTNNAGAAVEGSREDGITLDEAVAVFQTVLDSLKDKSLSFSVVEELSRTVVSVRVVGSDELIRQFPPEEFVNVAKFLAALHPGDISDDYLKGILYDGHT